MLDLNDNLSPTYGTNRQTWVVASSNQLSHSVTYGREDSCAKIYTSVLIGAEKVLN